MKALLFAMFGEVGVHILVRLGVAASDLRHVSLRQRGVTPVRIQVPTIGRRAGNIAIYAHFSFIDRPVRHQLAALVRSNVVLSTNCSHLIGDGFGFIFV